jgi:hypothetical protein
MNHFDLRSLARHSAAAIAPSPNQGSQPPT